MPVSRPRTESVFSEQEHQVLDELTEHLGYQLTYDELLYQLVEAIARVIPQVVSGYLFRLDDLCQIEIRHGQLLSLELQQQLQQHLFQTWKLLSGDTIEHYQVRSLSKAMQGRSQLPLTQLDSLLCVPLIIPQTQKVVGLLFTGMPTAGIYGEEQLRFLSSVASQGAIAIRRLQTLLAVQQRRLFSLVEHLPDGVILFDGQGSIVLANQTAWKYIALLTRAGCPEVLTQVDCSISPKTTVHELNLEGYPKLVLEVNVQSVPMDARSCEWLAIVRDITERKQAETQLAQGLQELTSSNAELQRFATVAAHDLQAPLSVVSGYLEVLEKSYKSQLDPKANRFIAQAVDGTKRMQRLIEDLLSYTRLSSQAQALETVNCELVLEQAIANLQMAIAATGAKIHHTPLPTVQGHFTQLVQLFQNLISNGLKYQPLQASPCIQIGAERQNNQWLFVVQDNGIGIEPQYADQIFMPFHRLHSRAEYPGTGMGLAIAKKIVEHHRGQIWVESQPNQGSQFYFTLPYCNRNGNGSA